MPTATARNVGSLCDAQVVVIVFVAELWAWDARRADSWTFVSLPVEASDEIRELASGPRRGFGSLRVRVAVGVDALPGLKTGDSARAASCGTSEASCFAGNRQGRPWSYIASTGV
jgi:Domain of unknown function (DUF1905)